MCKLGFWQLDRASQKEQALLAFQQIEQLDLSELLSSPIDEIHQFHGRKVEISGQIDTFNIWLIDNKTHNGRVGYSVVVNVAITGQNRTILMDIGWTPASKYREQLPTLQLPKNISVNAKIKSDSFERFTLATSNNDIPATTGKRQNVTRVQSYQDVIKDNLSTTLPLIAFAPSNTIDGMPQLYNPVVMPPEKHVAYAVQWFLLALASIIVFLFASRTNSHNNKHNQELNDES